MNEYDEVDELFRGLSHKGQVEWWKGSSKDEQRELRTDTKKAFFSSLTSKERNELLFGKR